MRVGMVDDIAVGRGVTAWVLLGLAGVSRGRGWIVAKDSAWRRCWLGWDGASWWLGWMVVVAWAWRDLNDRWGWTWMVLDSSGDG